MKTLATPRAISPWLRSALLSMLILWVGGCGFCKSDPEPGDGCEGLVLRCDGTHAALVCTEGKLRRVSCKGGCAVYTRDRFKHLPLPLPTQDRTTLCDFSENSPGEACPESPLPTEPICTKDGQRVQCVNGSTQWTADSACRGNAAPDEPCKTQRACSTDGKRMFGCSKERWHDGVPCTGRKGCTVTMVKNTIDQGLGYRSVVTCDHPVAVNGSECFESGLKACTQDGKTILICQDGAFRGLVACSHGESCAPWEGSLACMPP